MENEFYDEFIIQNEFKMKVSKKDIYKGDTSKTMIVKTSEEINVDIKRLIKNLINTNDIFSYEAIVWGKLWCGYITFKRYNSLLSLGYRILKGEKSLQDKKLSCKASE